MKENKITILWTNADLITSELMVMMYATAAANRGLFERVQVVIWGATAKLVAENTRIQGLVATAKEAGVEFSACQACANKLDVESDLHELGIELISWGEPLTEIIKAEGHLLTI